MQRKGVIYKFWCTKNGKLKKVVLQYDLSDNLLKEWQSLSDIKRNLSFDISPISKCCKGKQKTSYDYKWKFKE